MLSVICLLFKNGGFYFVGIARILELAYVCIFHPSVQTEFNLNTTEHHLHIRWIIFYRPELDDCTICTNSKQSFTLWWNTKSNVSFSATQKLSKKLKAPTGQSNRELNSLFLDRNEWFCLTKWRFGWETFTPVKWFKVYFRITWLRISYCAYDLNFTEFDTIV